MLLINTSHTTRPVEKSGFGGRETVAGIECNIAPITLGAITLTGFQPMFWRACPSPLLANIISAWAIVEILDDGLEKLRGGERKTMDYVDIFTISSFAEEEPSDEDDDENTVYETEEAANRAKARKTRKTLQEMPVPDFLMDAMGDNPAIDNDVAAKINCETGISCVFTFAAGRHKLQLALRNMRLPLELSAAPIDTITANAVYGSITVIRDSIRTLSEGYGDALQALRPQIKQMPNIEKLPMEIVHVVAGQ
ncbi:hypothetical protein [Thalassospira sp.]|uniref:hypothetical protein n=1 Tax=Thalassospira sp. TaxID=1912094 RepID=UPI0025EB6E34|nr:hypothetical protein [Thalassospira sp.]|tara:strand:- start:3450 stop:4205 length:756 start_codon:yes stop_codon:yes gene_type:complete